MSPARLRLAFALLPGAVTLVVISMAFANARILTRDNEWVDHTRRVIERSDALLQHVMGTELRRDDLIVAGDHSAIFAVDSGAREDAEQILAAIRRLTADNASQRPRLDAIARELSVGIDPIATGGAVRRGGALDGPTQLALRREGRQHINRVRDLVTAVKVEEQRLLAERQAASGRQARIAAAVLVLGGALAVIVAILVNLFLTRIINERERMSRELGAQLDDLVAVRRELEARVRSDR